MATFNMDTIAYDVAFEIVLGGDRFDKEDVRFMLKEANDGRNLTEAEAEQFRKAVKANVRKIAPPEHDIDSGDYYPNAIDYWTSFPEFR